ncbi:MAG: hypothetical protein E7640_06260 [Ruminococcaceae bacterium]|nr:hypothetical protein [Oscillospiraceae bacterium]
MKILSLHIDTFGKLRDHRIDFDSGITEILGDNGYGKTTLAVFIKSMLYGIPDNRDKGKIRKKYAPWSGGDFGGTLDFETERGKYRVSRRFSPKTGDTFELISLETGLQSEDYGEDLGFELFGIDAESYEKCTYLPQHEVDVKITDSIGARLEALLIGSSGNDIVDFREAVDRIKDRRRELELYKGTGGLIENEKNALTECEKEIELLEDKLREAQTLRVEISELENSEKETEDEIDALYKKSAAERKNALLRKDYEMWQSYVADAEQCGADIEKIKTEFKNGVPNSHELERADALEREIAFERRKRAKLVNSEAENAESGIDIPGQFELTQRALDIRSLKDKKNELTACNNAPRKLSSPKMQGIMGIFITVLGNLTAIIGIFTVPALILFGAAVAILGGVIFFISKPEKESAHKDVAQRAEKEREIDRLEHELSEFFSKYGMIFDGNNGEALLSELSAKAQSAEKHKADEERRKNDIRSLDFDIEKKEAELAALLEKYGFFGESERSAREVSELVSKLKNAEKAFGEMCEKAERFKSDKEISEEPPVSELGEKELSRQIEDAQRNLRKLGSDKTRLAERAARLESDAELLPSTKDRREQLQELISEHTERREILDKTAELLEKAKENLSSRHIVDMKNAFEKRFSAIMNIEKEITVDAKFEVKLRDEGGAKKSDAYSTGWQSVIEICQRLALIDSLYRGERPFVILDDPFVNLDKGKISRIKGILRELSEDTQIIYLTCHESRSIK